ncbi:MAG: thioredoxin domain-containing protein [Rhodothermaceae bacterium]|nr:thioredoxin domain-containing protein [Rhodothermaceae bacterium]MYG68838.1 thioredoxin domain-containing protein [Rhodothermaceae bacterium]MYJ43978.1 thioredoxin domain-containing protein [Rhodothermaceae bacterium]
MYEKQGSLQEDSWVIIAQEIGIPEIEGFVDCLESDAVREKLEVDQRLAESLGITSIPTFIVNEKLFVGLLSVAELDAVVRYFLRNE